MVAPLLLAAAPAAISAVASAFGAHKQNKEAAERAREQMAFQERMSSTAHQREVGDLRAAGLNPILSGTGGAGSSTPAGSSPPVVNELAEAGDRVSQIPTTALAIKTQREAINLLQAQVLGAQVGAAKTVAETQNITSRTALQDAALPIPAAIADVVSAVREWLRDNAPSIGGSLDGLKDAVTSAIGGATQGVGDGLDFMFNSARRIERPDSRILRDRPLSESVEHAAESRRDRVRRRAGRSSNAGGGGR